MNYDCYTKLDLQLGKVRTYLSLFDIEMDRCELDPPARNLQSFI